MRSPLHFIVCVLALLALFGCGGDGSGGGGSPADAGTDAVAMDSGGGGSDAAADAEADTAVEADTADLPDSDGVDTGAGDTGADDTGIEDTGADDTGADDTGADDTGIEDTGADDTGAPDSSMDTGIEDTGVEDTDTMDTGADDTGADDTGTPDSAMDTGGDDVGDTSMGGEELVGQLNVTWWQEDALFAYPEVFGHAAFSRSLAELGVEDAVGLLAQTEGWDVFLPFGYALVPALGEWEMLEEAPRPDELGLMDAGLFVNAGEHITANVDGILLEEEGARIYDMLLELGAEAAAQQDPAAPMDLVIDGGEDIAGGVFPGGVTLPPLVEVTSHDPMFPVPLRYGRPLVLEWVPSEEAGDSMLITVEGEEQEVLWHTEDDGVADLSELLEESGVVLGERPAIVLTRLRQREVQLPEGRLKVVTTTRQWLYPNPVGPYTVEPRLWPTGATTVVEIASWDAPFEVGEAPRVDLGEGIEVESARVLDEEGHRLELTLRIPLDTPSGPRGVSLGGTPEAPVLEIAEAAWVVASLAQAGDCQSALDEGPVADGAYTATTDGLGPSAFEAGVCELGNPNGSEQAIPVSLVAGQTLTARLSTTELFGVMYLADSCEALDSPFACEHALTTRWPLELVYTAEADEEVLLVVDHYAVDDTPGEYAIDIQRSEPAPFTIYPPLVTSSGSEELELLSLSGPFDPETFTVDFGEGITVVGVEVDEFEPEFAFATIEVDNDAAAGLRDVTAQVGDQSLTALEAFEVQPFLNSPGTCEGADSNRVLTPGFYEGLTLLGGRDTVSPEDCLGQTADGMESIFRVDLEAGETLRAAARMRDGDVVLYAVEACGEPTRVCADNAGPGQAEVVEWVGPDRPSTVYLVVDGFNFDDGGIFDLQIEIFY